jgi:hypothetical protein
VATSGVTFLALCALGLTPGQWVLIAGTPDSRSGSDVQSEAFFADTNLTVFHVEIGSAEYRALGQQPRRYVEGKVRVNGKSYEQVGVRLKGTGTFQPVSMHPNLSLKFNWKLQDQEFCGLTKIFLNNSRQDPTFLCELAASGAFADASLPAPRITHGRVFLNGRELGLCVVAEAVNKRFLKRHFGSASGNLYEGEFRDIGARLEQDNGPPGDRGDLRELAAAAQRRDPQAREALSKLLNTEQFLNFLALEMMVANWDGYAFHQNNYRIYHDPASDRMAFIPHGMDNTFFESGLSLMPPRNSALAAALLTTPEDRSAFRQRVAALMPVAFDPDKIRHRLQVGAERMCQGASAAEVASIRHRAELFGRCVEERARGLGAELAGLRPATPEFNWLGTASLVGWKPKPDWNDSMVEVCDHDGGPALGVTATNGWCFGSWRLGVWLPPGSYELQGMASTTGVAGLPSRTGSGAGVRVLGGMRGNGVQGSSSWMPVQYEFVVQPGCEWLELIAELRAFRGRAFFDPGKLRLVRVQ